MNNPYFIAEISSNHNGNLKRCFKIIDKAKEAGFDAVKFQLFRIEKLFDQKVIKKKKFLNKRKQWELPYKFIPKIKKYCLKKKIDFGCSPFDLDAVEELKKYVDFFKIASYEILWDELFEKCIATKKKLIFSTGMATSKEIKNRLKYLKRKKFEKISILHCVSSYPAEVESLNLETISYLRSLVYNNKTKVGWSDHSVNEAVIYKSIFKYDAEIIEMHFDLEGKGFEFKFKHCWLPHQAKDLIQNIRLLKNSNNYFGKKISKSEKVERKWRTDNFDGLRPLIEIRKSI